MNRNKDAWRNAARDSGDAARDAAGDVVWTARSSGNKWCVFRAGTSRPIISKHDGLSIAELSIREIVELVNSAVDDHPISVTDFEARLLTAADIAAIEGRVK